MTQLTARSDSERSPAKWADLLAASLVVHSPMPEPCIWSLEEIFVGVDDLWVVLANGGPSELECIPIISGSRAVRGPLVADWQVPPGLPSLCRQVMDSSGVLELRAGNEDTTSPSYSDWEELRARAGCSWVQAAALSCDGPGASVLGSLLLSGRGAGSPIDPDWLDDWGREMARCITHASVHVMEASLDVLRVIFSPQILERLVTGAVRARSPRHLLDVTAPVADWAADADEGADADSEAGPRAASAPRSDGDPLDLARVLPPPLQPSVDGSSPRERGSAGAACTPFAAAAAQHRPSDDSTQASTDEGTPAPRPRPRGSASFPGARHRRQRSAGAVVPLAHAGSLQDTALHLARLGSAASARISRAGTGSPLAALRAGSIESDTSVLFTDAVADSPRSCELRGYEDLLAEDRAEHARRMPSASLDRAHSRCSVDRELQAGGPAGDAGTGGAMVAAGGSGALTRARPPEPPTAPAPAPLPAPAQGTGRLFGGRAAVTRLTSIAEMSSGSVTSSLGGLLGARRDTTSLEVVAASLAVDALVSAHRTASGASGVLGGSEAGEGGLSSSGSLQGGLAGSLAGASNATAPGPSTLGQPAAQGTSSPTFILPRPQGLLLRSAQQWNLTFCDGELETAYQGWSAALSLQADALAGVVFAVLLAMLAETLLRAGALATAPGAALALTLAVLALPALASWLRPELWARDRVAIVLVLRLACCALTFVQVVCARAADAAANPASLGYGLVRAAQGQSPMLAMITATVCYRLPLSVNLPLQLACCWMSYTLYTLIWGSEGAGALALNLGAGFAVSNAFVFWSESRERRRFLYSSLRVEAAAADTLDEETRRASSGSGSAVSKAVDAAVAAAVH